MFRGGEPFVLSERHRWLRLAVTGKERDPTLYWEHLGAQPPARRIPPAVRALLRSLLPRSAKAVAIVHRPAGLGSLGRERFTALADWAGGKVAREAKALLPSACVWAEGRTGSAPILYPAILRRAIRVADPFLLVRGPWLVRRLAPYCSRIELRQLARRHDELKLLAAMGRELANVHAGTPRARSAVRRDWPRTRKRLRVAVERMAEATEQDWKVWHQAYEG
jgi:hypothetical protein